MKLIPTDSPLYRRRLCRELNSLPDGFYLGGVRCSRARFSKGEIEVSPCGSGAWAPFDSANFVDAYGRVVTASRRAS